MGVFNKGTEVEKLHLELCKRVQGVKKSTCNIMVYFELGRIPLEYMRLFRIIKYWFKLLTTTNCILKEAYNVLLDLSDSSTVHNYNWVTFLKNKLMLLGFGDWWLSQPYVNEKYFLPLIKTRIFDQAKQNLYSILNN